MRKKIAVITGGAGFIGSHLCDKFIRNGYKVICLDNFITGKPQNIKHLLKDMNFRFKEHNVSKYIEIKGKVDLILHFASPASPEDYLKFPIQTLKVGSLGTHNCLGLAKNKKSRFLLASTSEVYGDPLVHPQPESYWGHVNPVGVRGCYDEAKRFAEAMAMAYHRVHKLDTRIVRIFNTYGPRMRINDGRVVPNFIYQAMNGLPITVYGNGTQTRSFCYVSDLVDGIYKLAAANIYTPVNLGNPREFTILQFAKMVLAACASKGRIIYKELPVDDPRQRKPDISLARKALHWQPKVDLENGLLKTIQWFTDDN
ncbi:MAG: SDR family oxidoreductase [Candidatus Omnitrophica bacterium]|nr:SDR family oxidoreductase [Candidatus Omnitrophota bacterium]